MWRGPLGESCNRALVLVRLLSNSSFQFFRLLKVVLSALITSVFGKAIVESEISDPGVTNTPTDASSKKSASLVLPLNLNLTCVG